ncbi:SGNH/GDSL hydrolase family protein [Lederbergia panacisoli]|uniref:SGNH/GDSL hydrolase family protein n=1 Tax=Lederbergia panacisoli TaxID=1255251 RepID=UPI00214C9E6B|nr:SGNH/GDSL hydrolase family protein [Lederbergia panacisoli]MCR2822249.1 SGNH/GDSL hydrolase family protein [Lederbergia panacisoli]
MQKVIRRSRAFILMLAFLLVLAPLSALADVETKVVNYVALGDSLAAGLLSNNTPSTGYVGYIKSDLESNGYEVNVHNKGVNGATSMDILNGVGSVTELASADIVTISVGANDALAGLDASLLAGIDPKYLDPANLALLQKEVVDATAAAAAAKVAAKNAIKKAQDDAGSAKGKTGEVKIASSVLNEKVPDDLKLIIATTLQKIMNDIDAAVNHAATADNSLIGVEETFNAESLTKATEELGKAFEKLSETESTLKGIPSAFLTEDLKNEIEIFLTLLADTKTTVTTAKTSVEHSLSKVNEYSLAQAKAIEAKLLFESIVAKINELQGMIISIQENIKSVGTNMAGILGTIKTINPTAKIYVMGYYNALPNLPSEVIVPLLTGLNNALKVPTDTVGATFVPTFHLFEGKYQTYLPNPTNIHPSVEGYRALANGFMAEISKSFPKVSEPEQPGENNVNLGEKVNVGKGELLLINGTNVSLLLPENLPDGTMLTVSATDKDTLAKAKDLKSAGDALNFNFEFPEGAEDYEGTFELVMGFDGDSSDDVNIYYYNEDKAIWENQEGNVNKESKTISLNVSHFSNYGVFDKAVEKEDPIDKEDPVDDKDPVDPKDPIDKEDPVDQKDPPVSKDPNKDKDDKKDDSSKKPIKDDKKDNISKKPINNDKKLPNTATNSYNWMLLGGLLLTSGFTSLVLRKKQLF